MHKTSLLLIFVAAVGIGSVLYLMGGSVSASGPGEISSRYGGKAPFQEHFDEALAENPRLVTYFDQLEALNAQYSEATRVCESFQGHLDSYFSEAESKANAVRDSSLRQSLVGRILAEKDTLTTQSRALGQAQNKLEQLAIRAEDLANAIRIMSSMKHLRLWAGPNRPDPKTMNALSDSYSALVQEWEGITMPKTASITLP